MDQALRRFRIQPPKPPNREDIYRFLDWVEPYLWVLVLIIFIWKEKWDFLGLHLAAGAFLYGFRQLRKRR